MDKEFEKDVISGLSSEPKYLSSRYFYDEKGDRLFQQIMDLDEYYLTRSEYQIFEKSRDELLKHFTDTGPSFNLLEFGAGDGLKTKVLLRHFVQSHANFAYRPIDISANVIRILEESLHEEMPHLDVRGIENEYFKALETMENGDKRNVVLFLGSNIGNFRDDLAITFLSELQEVLKKGDMVLIGFDLVKHPAKILAAYNDGQGVTAEFNLNLLDRINRELGGNFGRDKFLHYPVYNPATSQAMSFLISREKQVVEVSGKSFHFRAYEPIHMEISRKFHPEETNRMAEASGFTVVEQFFDSGINFMDALWKK